MKLLVLVDYHILVKTCKILRQLVNLISLTALLERLEVNYVLVSVAAVDVMRGPPSAANSRGRQGSMIVTGFIRVDCLFSFNLK